MHDKKDDMNNRAEEDALQFGFLEHWNVQLNQYNSHNTQLSWKFVKRFSR